jgi:anti-anti-sigma regulatory factor
MAGLEIHREDGKVTLQLEGTFDGAAALRLRQSLEGLSADEVVLDFTRVQQFKDLAIAVLMRGVQARNLRFRGLGVHQERMFRYFGVDVARSSEPAYYRPEAQAL